MTERSKSPRTLPMRCQFFVDRQDEITRFREAAGRGGQLLRAIGGIEGIGKTALALELGHQCSDAYPDGILFIDCRGAELPTPLPADEIAASLLRQLSVAEEAIPVLAEDRLRALHRELYGARVMLVLDDVAGAEQVQPLLFDSPVAAVVVTSRNKLAGLRASGFDHIRLGLLPDREAETLLRRVGGSSDLKSTVLRDVRAVCDGWPLALTVAGARLADPDESPEDYAAELVRQQLAALEIDERNPAQIVLDLSYHGLGDRAARSYALLATIPGPHFDLGTAAIVLGLDEAETGRVLRELADRYLLERLPHARFAFHGLIRAHAREAALASFPPADIDRAVSSTRWCRWRRAVALDQAVTRRPVPLGAEDFYQEIARASGTEFEPRTEFELEWPNLVAAMQEPGTPADQRLALLFPLALWSFGYQTGRCAELIDAYRHALGQATSSGETWQLYRDLAGLHERLGELDAAEECLKQASRAGHESGVASVHDWHAQIRERRGDLDAAVAELLASWEAVPMMDDPEQRERAYALLRMHLGRVRRKKGELPRAELDSAAALRYFTEQHEQVNLAMSASDLGTTLALLERHAEAAPLLERAHTGFRAVGRTDDAARAADELARIAELDGDARAADSWHRAAGDLRESIT